MQEWNALATRLVLGSDTHHSPFTTEDPALQGFFDKLSSEPADRQLVLALAGLQWMRKLGNKFNEETTESTSIPHSGKPPSPLTIEIIRAGLQARHYPLLRETFIFMRSHGQVLPPSLLVDCFSIAEKHPALPLLVGALAGERGMWLVQQNPDWHLIGRVDLQALHGDALLALLRELRSSDTQKFLHTVDTLWGSLPAKDRQKILVLFDVKPQHDDLPFLQKHQQDRSQAVRYSICGLRARLHDPVILDMAKNVVTSSLALARRGLLRKQELEIKLPEGFDKAWEALGIQETLEHIAPAGKLGRRSAWLHQWLALVPPRILMSVLDTNTETYLEQVVKSDHTLLLGSAWAHAALLHDETDALCALMKHVPGNLLNQWLQVLLPQSSGACRDALLQITLSPPDGTIALPLDTALRACDIDHPMPPNVSRLLLRYLTRDAESVAFPYVGLQQRLDEVAFHIEVSQIPEWITHLESRLPAALEGCLRWLRIRQQLHQEFSQ